MKIDIKTLFLGLQDQLAADLEVCRRNIFHPGTKGDAAEINWLGMLEEHLPSRYQAKKAHVIDADGEMSDQIDVVIFDRHYCPLLFNQAGALYVPAESVYAAFEVKQTLSKEYIEYAGDKIASIRKLRRTSALIPHAGGVFSPKTPFGILGGILTLESEWNPGLGKPFSDLILSLPEYRRLDLGCSLQHGAFETIVNSGEPVKAEVSEQKTALVFFFMRLLHRLQQLGTVPAIDLREYTKDLC